MRTRRNSLLIAAVATGVVALTLTATVTLLRLRDTAHRSSSSANVRSLTHALTMYQQTHGVYPPADTWQDDLVNTGLITPEMLAAPGAAPERIGYIYRPPRAGRDRATEPMLWEYPDLWDGRAVAVGFSDNHVDLVEPGTLIEITFTPPAAP